MVELSQKQISFRWTSVAFGIAVISIFLIGTPADLATIPLAILLELWVIYFVFQEKLMLPVKGWIFGIALSVIFFNMHLFMDFSRLLLSPLYLPGTFLRGNYFHILASHVTHGLFFAGIFFVFDFLRKKLT